MSPKQRLVAALDRRPTDRLPVTTHHLMRYHLDKYLPGKTEDEFFATFGLNPITWVVAHRPAPGSGCEYEPGHVPGFLEARRLTSATWRFEHQTVTGREYATVRHADAYGDSAVSTRFILAESDRLAAARRERTSGPAANGLLR